MHPTLTSDDRFLYFSSYRAGGYMRMDIWVSERIGPGITDWSIPVNLGPKINTDMDEGAPSVTNDHNRLYFQAYNRTILNFDLYYSDRDPITKNWNPRTHLGWVINSTDYNDRHPCITKNEEILYFDSDRPDGEGDFDIWVSRKFKGIWTNPRPLTHPINTSSYEAAPYVYQKGSVRQLYFESARGGVSKLYVSEWNPVMEEWDPPKLMCHEFISALHPFINSTGTELFYHTAKVGGYGSEDIWVAQCLPSPTPTGTWFSPTPTLIPTHTPIVPLLAKSNQPFLAVFVSLILIILVRTRNRMS